MVRLHMYGERAVALGLPHPSKDKEEAMTMLKQMMIAIAVLVALSAPSSAKTLADEIWDQINQTMPNRPSADEFRDALP